MNITRVYARTGRTLHTHISRSLYNPTRTYATSAPLPQGHPGHHPHTRLYLLIAAVGVPAAFWLSSRRPNPTPLSTFEERHGLNPEYKQATEANTQGRDPDYCEHRAWGAPRGPSTSWDIGSLDED